MHHGSLTRASRSTSIQLPRGRIIPNAAMSRQNQSKASPRPLKILMLHGYTQNGPLFHSKTRALEKNLQKAFAPSGGVELHYPTGPIKLAPADIPTFGNEETKDADQDEDPEAYSWWRTDKAVEPPVYRDIDFGFEVVAGLLKEKGPFDGVLGFSQGGCFASMVASLLETGRREIVTQAAQSSKSQAFPQSFLDGDGDGLIQSPLKFAVIYSGFGGLNLNKMYHSFYDPPMKTATLHFIGSLDTVVDEKRSLSLVKACEGASQEAGTVVYHPGGHFVPSSQKQCVGALIGFIKDVMAKAQGGGKEEEEDAADMHVPF